MTGKSKEEIAFELLSKLKGVGVWGENNMSSILDMYTECLEATSGNRVVESKAPKRQSAAAALAAPIPTHQAAPAPQAPLQQPMMHQPQVR